MALDWLKERRLASELNSGARAGAERFPGR